MIASPAIADPEQPYQLDVSLVRDVSGRTHIGGQYVAYPFHLCRALRTLGDPADMPTLYIQSCSGGLFEGEDLHCRLRVGAKARAHVTTAASTIVHTMESGTSAQCIEIDVAAEGFLEYLPEPLILFPGASLFSSVHMRVAPSATVLAWDSFFAHDPKPHAQGGTKVFRELVSELSISDENGRLLARDRFRAEGAAFQRAAPGVMNGYRTQAGFVLVRRDCPVDQWTTNLRESVSECTDAYIGVSALPNATGLWVRILAPDAARCRDVLARVWSRARETITGVVPVPRRK